MTDYVVNALTEYGNKKQYNMIIDLTIKEIVRKFKKEFKDYDFDSKKRNVDLVCIRYCYFYLCKIGTDYNNGEIISGLKLVRDRSTVNRGKTESESLILSKDKVFMYFYKRALKCLTNEYKPLTTEEKLSEEKIKNYVLTKSLNSIKVKESNYKSKIKNQEQKIKDMQLVLDKYLRTELRPNEEVIDNTSKSISEETGIGIGTVDNIINKYWDKKEKELIKRVNN